VSEQDNQALRSKIDRDYKRAMSDDTLTAAAKADPGSRHWLRITIDEISYSAHSSSPRVTVNFHDERNSGYGQLSISGNALALMLGSDFKLGDELVLAKKVALSAADIERLQTADLGQQPAPEGQQGQSPGLKFGSTIGKGEADKSLYNPRQEHKT
jgi:hypothetical protein